MRVAKHLSYPKLYKHRRSNNKDAMFYMFEILKMILEVISGLIKIIAILGIKISKQIYKIYRYIRNYKQYEENLSKNIDLEKLTQTIITMEGREFEIFISNLLKANKIPCTMTSATCDGGKDLICNINGKLTYIELKRHVAQIGRPDVQKLIGSCVGDKIESAIFITTGEYTTAAIEYSNKIDYLYLWNMEHIQNLILNLDTKQINRVIIKTLNIN